MRFHRLLPMIVAGVVAGGGVTPAPALASCQVNVGDCAGGDCRINLGYCGPGARCTVNTGTCTAGTGDPEGRACGFNSVTDVTTEPGKQAAVVQAGPLVTFESGTLFCTIVVNASSHAASGRSVSVTAVNGVVVLPPTTVQYNATAADTVALCSRWAGASGTRYWVGATPAGLGHWSTNPSDSCGVALPLAPNYPECPVWLAVDRRLGTPLAETWQDCEPYDPIV